LIKFMGVNDEGLEMLEGQDWSRRHKGPVEFTFRKQEKDEPLWWYMDRLMTQYWHASGKNKRRYQDE
jgi:hypothetical protein